MSAGVLIILGRRTSLTHSPLERTALCILERPSENPSYICTIRSNPLYGGLSRRKNIISVRLSGNGNSVADVTSTKFESRLVKKPVEWPASRSVQKSDPIEIALSQA